MYAPSQTHYKSTRSKYRMPLKQYIGEDPDPEGPENWKSQRKWDAMVEEMGKQLKPQKSLEQMYEVAHYASPQAWVAEWEAKGKIANAEACGFNREQAEALTALYSGSLRGVLTRSVRDGRFIWGQRLVGGHRVETLSRGALARINEDIAARGIDNAVDVSEDSFYFAIPLEVPLIFSTPYSDQLDDLAELLRLIAAGRTCDQRPPVPAAAPRRARAVVAAVVAAVAVAFAVERASTS